MKKDLIDVVDKHVRVRGGEKLRIVDTSTFPLIYQIVMNMALFILLHLMP